MSSLAGSKGTSRLSDWMSSVFRLPSSVFRLPSSVFRLPSSPLHPPLPHRNRKPEFTSAPYVAGNTNLAAMSLNNALGNEQSES